MKRVLITGGTGFLGSHLCDSFIREGFSVIAMDNFITSSQANVAHLLDHDRFTFIKHDVTQDIHIEGPLDYILHFASPASPNDYLNYPIQTLKVGSLGTHKVLGLAKAKRSTFLLASTSEVYGDPLEHPQKETYWGNVNPIGPRGVYDEAKRFAEALTMAYGRCHHLEVRICRIFNTFGPRMRPDDGRVVSNFIIQTLEGQPLTVYGDGSQTRSFCYVSDMVGGIIKLLFSSEKEPVNLGNPEEMSVLELARLVLRLSNRDCSIQFKPLPQDDPKVRKPDITKAKKVLNWQPTVSLEEGIKATIEYFSKMNREQERGYKS